jgi:hypothetical protein
MKINFPEYACRYAAELARKCDQFRRQMQFDAAELENDDDLPVDPFGELDEASGVYGLKHRFPDRVLVMRIESDAQHSVSFRVKNIIPFIGEYNVEEGDLIIVFPNQMHRFETIDREKYILLIVNPDLLSELTKIFISGIPTSNLIKGGALDPELWSLAQSISKTYSEDEPYKDTVLHGYLLAFFGKLLPRLTIKDVPSKECNVHS